MSTENAPGDVTNPATAQATSGNARVEGLPDRAVRVASWVGWHLPEIAGVTVPAVAAVTLTPWAWVACGLVTAGWTVHDVRIARRNTANRAGAEHGQATTANTTTDITITDVSQSDGGDVTDAMTTDWKAAQ